MANNEIKLSFYANQCIEMLIDQGKKSTANSYSSAIKTFLTMSGDIELSDINSNTISKFTDFLISKQISQNTISYYISALRSIYRKAVRESLTTDSHPFCDVNTTVIKTGIKALSEEELNIIKDLDLSHNPSLAFARDMFMLSFYMRGVSYNILAQLTKSNIKHGTIVYSKRGVSDNLEVKIEPCIQDIIERYKNKTIGTDYLLPIVTGTDNTSIEYTSSIRLLNLRLKKIAKYAEIGITLTSATAKHTWATIAIQKGVSKQTISRCLGYNTEELTRNYFREIEQGIINRANELVIVQH